MLATIFLAKGLIGKMVWCRLLKFRKLKSFWTKIENQCFLQSKDFQQQTLIIKILYCIIDNTFLKKAALKKFNPDAIGLSQKEKPAINI